MSRAKTRATNISRLLDNLGAAGRLSLAAMQLHLPRVIEVRWSHTGKSLRIGKDWLQGATGTAASGWSACSRVQIEGQGTITAELTFYYQGYGNVVVRAHQRGERHSVISFPVPVPYDWRYPDAAARLANMSRLGEFS